MEHYNIKDIVVFEPIYPAFNPILFKSETEHLSLNTPYDIYGLFCQLIWNVFGTWIGNRRNKALRRMYCYESMAYLHRKSETFFDWWKVKPIDLFNSKDFKRK